MNTPEHFPPLFRRELPSKAKQFVDEMFMHIEEATQAITNPELRAAIEQIDENLEILNPPKYTLRMFRDSHRYFVGHDSITNLYVSDDTLMDLLEADIYSITALQTAMGITFTEKNISIQPNRNRQNDMTELEAALAHHTHYLQTGEID